MAVEHLKCDLPELGCIVGTKYIPDFKRLGMKESDEILSNFFCWLHVELI